MTHRATVAGITYLTNNETFEIDGSGFFDIELTTSWVPLDSNIDALRVKGPENVWAWVDIENREVWIPELPIVMRGWQLRQVTPAVSACFDRLVIHASASRIREQAVAFVGESGAGKSSLAWELLKAGHPLVSDDLLPIRFTPNPTVPSEDDPIPLAAVCLLSRSASDLTMRTMDKVEALDALIRNGFGEHNVPSISAAQFDGYHRIADAVSHLDLVVPDDRDRLADTATQIVARLATVAGEVSP